MATPAANSTSTARPRLGEILLREGRISAEQLQRALNEQAAYGGRLGRQLLDLGFINEAMLLDALSRQLRIPIIDPDAVGVVATDAARYGRADQCEQWGFVPLQYDQKRNVLIVAVADPDPQLLSDIEGFLGMRVELRIAPAEKIDRTIRRLFHGEGARIETKQLQGLQVARSASKNVRDEGLNGPGPAPVSAAPPPVAPQPPPQAVPIAAPMHPGSPAAAMQAGPPLDYNSQIAQQLSMQHQLQAQLQQQLQMQQYQLQAAAQAAQAQQMAAYAQPAIIPTAAPVAAPVSYAPPPAAVHAPPTQPAPPRPSDRPGFDSLIEAIPDSPSATAPPAGLTAPPERGVSTVERSHVERPHGERSRRAGPAIDVEAPRNEGPSLEALAEQVGRLEKTLTAQARALRSLVEVLEDRGLISRAEMARKQQGK